MTNRRILASAALWLCAIAAPAGAHHSFAQFDMTKTTLIHGTLFRVEWTNPHMWVWITADNGDKWGFEAGAPAQLVRSGFPRSSLKEGSGLSVSYHPARSGQHGGSLVKISFDDGRVISDGAAIPKQPAPGGPPPAGQ